MKITLGRWTHYRRFATLTALLACLGATSCFRKLDSSKVPCAKDPDCPKGYTCSLDPISNKGHCVSGIADNWDAAKDGPRDQAAGGKDGGDARSNGGADGKKADASSGGADAPVGGSTGGAGGEAFGGTTSTGDTTSTGGTTGDTTSTGGTTGGEGPPQGSPCTGNAECGNNLCFDGFCCDKECTGCHACANAMTGEADGTCAPVAVGQNPHQTCTDETSTKPCGNDGTCDGKGACRKVSADQGCGTASCSADGTTFAPAPKCDGKGSCLPGSSQVCTPAACAVTGCQTACTTNEQCGKDAYCDTTAKTCATKKTNGKPATDTAECTSGVIADGVCCDKECKGCNACISTLTGRTSGTCMAVTVGTDPHKVCPAGSDPCGMNGTCNGAGGCFYPALESDCGTPSCNSLNSTLTKSTCKADHVCTAGTASACPGLMVCASTTACKPGPCARNEDCATGNFCASGTCTPKRDDGQSCTAGDNNQCRNGNCVGTTCCSTPCGECHSCANSTGKCNELGNGTACSSGVCYNGSCNPCTANQTCTIAGEECWNHVTSCSSGTSECIKSTAVTAGTSCGSGPTCSGTTASYGHWTCQGGTCTRPDATACPSTGCNPSTGTCNAACSTSQTPCGTTCCSNSSQYCSGTSCASKVGPGSSCPNGDLQCTTNHCIGGICCNQATCDSPHSCATGTCLCPQPSSTNRLVGPGFDGGVINPAWIIPDPGPYGSGNVSYSSDDADGCTGSGSAAITGTASFHQCVTLSPGTSYYFGLRYKGAIMCQVMNHTNVDCSYSDSTAIDFLDTTVKTAWSPRSQQATVPSGIYSLMVNCSAGGGDSTIDKIYLNTSANTF